MIRTEPAGVGVVTAYLPPDPLVKNLEEMLRFSLELWLVLLGLPVSAQLKNPLKMRSLIPAAVTAAESYLSWTGQLA